MRILRADNASDALRELIDEIVRLVLVPMSQLVDLPTRLVVLQLVEMYQRHRMNLDAIGDDELDPRQADTVARQLPPAKCSIGTRDVEHDRRARLWQFFEARALLCKIEHAVVKEALVALGAR